MLKKIWHAWKRFGQWIGDVISRILLVIFYFTLALPFGLIVRFTQDPLDIHSNNQASWVKREEEDISLINARRSF